MTGQPEDESGGRLIELRPGEKPSDPDLLPAVRDEDAAQVAVLPVFDVAAREGERRAIIPVHLQRENLKATVGSFAGTNWHRLRYHGLRVPFYLVALLIWAVVGLFRVSVRIAHWGFLLEQQDLRHKAVIDEDSREWMRLHKEAKETRKTRGAIVAVIAGGASLGAFLLVKFGPAWSQVTAGTAAVLILARAGRPEGHRIVSQAVVPPAYEPPTPAVITRGLASLGIGAINRAVSAGAGITFVSDVHRDGPGWAAHIDLPHGVTAAHIMAKRSELASGLRRPLSATWPSGVPAEHEGRLELWIGFHDLSKQKMPKWPLLKAGTADVFGSLPFGTDPRLRPVGVPMFEVNWLIGASPGQGKTGSVRVLACGAALDVTTDLWIHELAGKGDIEPLAKVSHRYVSGLDDESIAYAADSVRMLRAELAKRSKAFGQLPKEAKPEGKITRDLAAKGFRPLVVIFDEAQNLFLHPEFGAEAADDLAYVMRLGRALGIIVVLATQRPDKDSLPTTIRGIVTARFCLKVPDQPSNDMILGTGAYSAGYNAAIFRAKTDAGLGWLKGDGEPQIVRTYYLDLRDTERVAVRARNIRQRAGVLTGYALGEDVDERPERDVLADVLAVLGDRPAAHWTWLADALALRFPDRWHDLTAESISAQCRALGVTSVDVKMDGTVLKGCRKANLIRLVTG